MIFRRCTTCGKRERITLKEVWDRFFSLESNLRYHKYEELIPHTHIASDLIELTRRIEKIEKKLKIGSPRSSSSTNSSS